MEVLFRALIIAAVLVVWAISLYPTATGRVPFSRQTVPPAGRRLLAGLALVAAGQLVVVIPTAVALADALAFSVWAVAFVLIGWGLVLIGRAWATWKATGTRGSRQ